MFTSVMSKRLANFDKNIYEKQANTFEHSREFRYTSTTKLNLAPPSPSFSLIPADNFTNKYMYFIKERACHKIKAHRWKKNPHNVVIFF